jgi:hypothetical protein
MRLVKSWSAVHALACATKALLWTFLFLQAAQGFVGGAAQRVSILDFSTTAPKPRKHVPKPFPAGTVLSGRCGGILASPGLSVSLVSLDRDEYAIGDEVVYTLNLSSRGPQSIKVPTVFNLSDLEPDDPTASFTYAPLEIWLGLRDSEHRLISTLILTLYGSDDIPATQMELKSGEFLAVKGKAKLEPTDQTGREYNADVDTHSSVPGPLGEVNPGVMSWKGDYLHFDGPTQHEFHGCHMYEVGVTLSEQKITLLPPRRN